MGQLLSPDQRAREVGALFNQNKKFMLASIPRAVGDPNRIFAVAFNAIIYNPDLLECFATKAGAVSVIAGAMDAMRLGLEIGGALQESWLVPFNDRRVDGKVAQLIVGYKGMRSVVARSTHVLDLMAHAVFDGDEYDFALGDSPYIRHKPGRAVVREPETLIATYAIAHLPRGGKQMRWLWREEIEKHRARSRAAQQSRSPWHTDYIPMALKTAVRVIWPFLPRSADMARIERLEEDADRGDLQVAELDGLILPEALKPETKTLPAGGALDELTRTLKEKQGVAGSGRPVDPPHADDIEWGSRTEREPGDEP